MALTKDDVKDAMREALADNGHACIFDDNQKAAIRFGGKVIGKVSDWGAVAFTAGLLGVIILGVFLVGEAQGWWR